ncbi:hypothetical protein DYQ86_21550 [Acidobacteria bacterium AB60]|nr:hypothetical protein DYQ86_21550 [Acidobacteria bacterium AB60]
MKRAGCIALMALATIPAWAAKKMTVAELKDLLTTLHQQGKGDADVAAALKQVQLSEELTRGMMNSLVPEVPGQLSTEQIYVLEARSAMLPPPATDIPSAPAPDAAGQQALLTKADDFVNKTYAQTPAITATRTTLRFQDNVEALAASSGMHGSASDVSVGSGGVNPYQFVHYINASDATIALEHGEEKLPEDKTRWGGNGMIAITTPTPNLTQVWSEAKDSGSVKWLRWELVNGKQAAVFSFEVPKKKTHMAVNVCCFPKIDQTGTARFSSAGTGIGTGGGGAIGSAGGAKGNFQTNTNYDPYKTVTPYRGEFFIDPDTGTVVRLITWDELKNTDVVHQLDTRVDYGPVTVGDKSLVLPIKTIVDTEVVPYGESGAGGYHTRDTLFTSEYKNQQLAGSTAQK